MEFDLKSTTRIVALLLLLAAITQAAYTSFYVAIEMGVEVEVPRRLLWGLEGILFTAMTAFAGSAMIQAGRHHLGWSAIAFASVLNIVQVGVGLTMFVPFREVANSVEATAPAASAVVAFSFMVYNAAKALLALAAMVFGMAKMSEGKKVLGGLTVFVGVVALISNAAVMAMGLDYSTTSGGIFPSGGSGVLATVLLAFCLMTLGSQDD